MHIHLPGGDVNKNGRMLLLRCHESGPHGVEVRAVGSGNSVVVGACVLEHFGN